LTDSSWPLDADPLDQKKRLVKENQHLIGTAIVFHETQKLDEFPIISASTTEDISQNQTPSDLSSDDLDISNPIFLDTQHSMIYLFSGESVIYDLSRFGS
jgi:hypothetical protein